MSIKAFDDTTTIKFLGKDFTIKLSQKSLDFILFLVELEYKELSMKNGLYFYNRVKEFGIKFSDDIDKQILAILKDRKNSNQ